MRKKNGWSINEMLILISVILVFLLIATFFVIQMMQQFKTSFKDMHESNQNAYLLIEEKLVNAVVNNVDISTNNIYKSDVLIKENYLDKSDLITEDEDICTGYVVVNNSVVRAYIKCKNYVSIDYQS